MIFSQLGHMRRRIQWRETQWCSLCGKTKHVKSKNVTSNPFFKDMENKTKIQIKTKSYRQTATSASKIVRK